MWFEELTGFRETSPAEVRENIAVDDEYLFSKVNRRRMVCGRLEIPTLGELRERVRRSKVPRGDISVTETSGAGADGKRRPSLS